MGVADYWAKCSSGDESNWKYIECLRSAYLLLSRPNSNLFSVLSTNKCKQTISFNILVCLYQLGMYQQALKMAN